MKNTGLRVRSLPRDGFLFASGLRPRDRVISVNGCGVADELDFFYHCADGFFEIEIERGGRYGALEVERPFGAPLVAEFFEKPINRCANRCVFCFIDQMPKGLRRSLYIKDEDFKHSFLNGNYVTLASASQEDLRRIVSIGLSPLFISVHAVEPAVRAAMLGNNRAPDIAGQLSYLSDNGVAFHTQIVLCPGLNDRAVLERTVMGLFGYGKSLLSIAVVPVGLTKFRKRPLAPVDEGCARLVCGRMMDISERMKDRDGVRKLFLADEFFIRANLPIPPALYYEDYPQIENGVGLLRQMFSEGAKIKRGLRKGVGGCAVDACVDKCVDTKARSSTNLRKSSLQKLCGRSINKNKKNILVLTGCSAYPFLKKVLDDIGPLVNKNFDIHPVKNRYFGETVTVAGLLSAKDVIRKAKELSSSTTDTQYSEVLLPRAMFNHAGYTLDGYSSTRIEKIINLPLRLTGTVGEIIGEGAHHGR